MRTGVLLFVRKSVRYRHDMPAMRFLAQICALASCLMMASPIDGAPTPKRDINAVLADVDDRLLAIPGVVGVYVGLLDDGETVCLKVMVSDRKAEASIPKSVEGYPVIVEITGELRPLQK